MEYPIQVEIANPSDIQVITDVRGSCGWCAWEPGRLATRSGGVEVYRSEDFELRTGDLIRWTRNDAGLGLVNSGTAEAAAVRDGKVGFRLEDGRRLDLSSGDPQLRRIDRAWAFTVHSFQGRTVDTVIAAMEAKHPNLTTQQMLYVEISRARDRTELVTDDRESLRESLEAATVERIAALDTVGTERTATPEAGLDAVRDVGKESAVPKSSEPCRAPEIGKAPKSIEYDLAL